MTRWLRAALSEVMSNSSVAAPESQPGLVSRFLSSLGWLLPPRFRADIPVVPVVRLSGVIGVSSPLRPGLMLATTAKTLERAFSVRKARAVALVINSPGGSPSQSHLIFRRIRQLSEEKKIPGNCPGCLPAP